MAAKVKALQEWCRRQCEGYRDVTITNMTSSWKSGLAFCAIIHKYRPDLIDYDHLSKHDVYKNNKLAFDVARDKLGIPALLDPEDMEIMKVPDKLCIVTYVAQYYNYFHNKMPGGSPVKVAPKRSSLFEELSPTIYTPVAKKPVTSVQVDNMSTSTSRHGGTMDDRCHMCHSKVYLLERHVTSSGLLYHRHCYRGQQRTSTAIQKNTPTYKVSSDKENEIPSLSHIVNYPQDSCSAGSRLTTEAVTSASTHVLTSSAITAQPTTQLKVLYGTPTYKGETAIVVSQQQKQTSPNISSPRAVTLQANSPSTANPGTINTVTTTISHSTSAAAKTSFKWTLKLPQTATKNSPSENQSSCKANRKSTLGSEESQKDMSLDKAKDSAMAVCLLKPGQKLQQCIVLTSENTLGLSAGSRSSIAVSNLPLSGSKNSATPSFGPSGLGSTAVTHSIPSLLTVGSKSSYVTPVAASACSNYSGASVLAGLFSDGSRCSITPAGGMGCGDKTEWQLEAERRKAARNGAYIDPEKQARPQIATFHVNIKSNINSRPTTQLDKPVDNSVGDRISGNTSEDRAAWLADIPSSASSSKRGSGVGSWQSRYFGTCHTATQQDSHPVVRKKSDSSEPPMSTDEILCRLEDLDKQLRVIESEGREVEDAIRKCSDDAMDDDIDNNMVKWFALIKQRYELIREESYLMYRKRQQELENLHEELEYQLRCLYEKPDELKSAEDKLNEERLLAELVETVSLRNTVVDSIEVDRLRYMEEDRKLEDMMAESGVNTSKCSKKHKNSQKKKVHKFAEKYNKSMDKAKTKKKLFYFTPKPTTSSKVNDNSNNSPSSPDL